MGPTCNVPPRRPSRGCERFDQGPRYPRELVRYDTVAYRQPATLPTEPPKPRTPVERLVVARYGKLSAAAIFGATVLVSAFVVYATFQSTAITCTRDAIGAVPRCTVTEQRLITRPHAPFDLHARAIGTAERDDDDGTEFFVTTPAGDLSAAVTRDFALATAAEAERFVATPTELHWSAARANTTVTSLIGLLAIAFLGIIASILKPTTLVLDPDADELRRGAHTAYRLADVRTAQVEEIDDSEFVRLVLVDGRGHHEPVAHGRERDAKAAARAIDAHLAKRRGTKDEAAKRA